MEKVFIDRNLCIAYAIIALHNIYHSANKERTMEEFAEEIKEITKIHTNEEDTLNRLQDILNKEGKHKITFNCKEEKNRYNYRGVC